MTNSAFNSQKPSPYKKGVPKGNIDLASHQIERSKQFRAQQMKNEQLNKSLKMNSTSQSRNKSNNLLTLRDNVMLNYTQRYERGSMMNSASTSFANSAGRRNNPMRT